MGKKILIIGATSVIARETARLFACKGDALFLVSRSKIELESVAESLRRRGASKVETSILDVLQYDQHDAVTRNAFESLGGLDLALVAHGLLPDQSTCEASFEDARKVFEINALSVISFLTILANVFERRRHGTIVVLSSVAGDRGRQLNYVYGAAKGAVNLFMQGLRNRLHGTGVNIITIKLGIVETRMSAKFRKNILWIGPDRAAAGIVHAINRGAEVVYVPWYWRYIMLVIRSIPEWLFKRLNI